MRLLLALLAVSVVSSCSFGGDRKDAGGGAGDGGVDRGADRVGGVDLAGQDRVVPACNPCSDFPEQPILDTPAGETPPPDDSPTRFGDEDSSEPTGGPCLIDPDDNALIPRNWLRPRFRWAPGSGQDLFELRLKSVKQRNELVVYTTATQWTMPKQMWEALSNNNIDEPITVTLRGMSAAGSTPAVGSKTSFSIAAAAATGSIVYWTVGTSSNQSTSLKGFAIGDEGVVSVLTPADVNRATPANPSTSRCIGCHSSTPDGAFIGFSSSQEAGNGDPAWTEIRSGTSPASRPNFLSASGLALLQRQSTEMPAFSPAHWIAGDHVAITMYQTSSGGTRSRLIWIDLEAASEQQGSGWDYLTGDNGASGDNGYAGNPAWSHNGATIAYHSSSSVNASGLMRQGGGDIFTMPYNNRQGGPAAKLQGASDPAYSELYPAWSPGDELIAFTRVPNDQDGYNNSEAEIMVVPAAGGQPIRIRANDPCKCLNRTSPGVTNSWPKWAPHTVEVPGRGTYYFLVFSSTREGGKPQIFVAPLLRSADEFGTLSDYPALYLWNQPADEGNHTPAWDMFQIPPVP